VRTARRLIPWLGALALPLACSTDASSPYPVQSCARTLWYHPPSSLSHVEVVTSWEGWQRGLHVLPADRDDGWRGTQVTPPPGPQEYAFIDDGQWVTDPYVGTTAFHDGVEVSLLFQDDCSVPKLGVDSASGTLDGAGAASLTFSAASDRSPLDPASVSVTPADGAAVASADEHGHITLSMSGLSPGKHVFEVTASNVAQVAAPPVRLTIWNEARPWDWRDAVIYQVIVDRYRGPGGALAAPAVASDWAGGTLSGLRADIDSGKLSALGFNALWLSPLYLNPDGSFPGNDGRPYSAYHGYWPKSARALDPRFGSEQDLDALVASAHAKDIRVVFDVVPHHVHQEHDYVAQHADGSWFTDWGQQCVCGVGTCDWSTHIEDCWFAPYLPSFDWHRDDVAATVTSDVSYWIDRFGGDGLRIDAVPMMPRAANRRIADDVRRRFDHPGSKTYVLGENFTGQGGFDYLRYDLGPFGLDGEFDFPMMWTIRGAIAQETEPLGDVDATEKTGESSFAGSGAVMARIIGNHDVTRFSSVSAGDADGDGWTPALQSQDALVYQKQRMALALAYTLPGAAVVYYGDEIGLAGRQDPDSRRVMPDDAALSPLQTQTRDFVAALGKLRACSDALRRGTYRALVTDAETLAFAREADSGAAAVVVVERGGATPVTLLTKGLAAGAWVDALGSGLGFDTSAATISLPGHSVAIFVPRGSACAP